MPDASFVICRLAYSRSDAEQSGIGWQTDYPYAEINLTTRLSELTKTRVSRDEDGTPNYYVVRLTDDALFNCPVLVASDAGTIGFQDERGRASADVSAEGGFLWVDDFWGTRGLGPLGLADRAASCRRRSIRSRTCRSTIRCCTAMFEVNKIPQITNIRFWRDSGGQETSERGSDSEDVHLRAIRDKKGRVMVLMTHNTDVADSWEREGEDPGFFQQFSPAGTRSASTC